jgi:pilus assembly protein Flp/PilA
MVEHILRFMREEDGTTAVEYGLMIALVSGALVAAVLLLGTNLNNTITAMAGTIAS